MCIYIYIYIYIYIHTRSIDMFKQTLVRLFSMLHALALAELEAYSRLWYTIPHYTIRYYTIIYHTVPKHIISIV